MNDTLGLITNTVADKLPEYLNILIPVITAIGAALFRIAQKSLQRLPTRWKWVNNRLTVSIMGKIVGVLFGKTTLLYNAKIVDDETANAELKKTALKHLSRQGGILHDFNKVVEK